jgi:hypothetical protein
MAESKVPYAVTVDKKWSVSYHGILTNKAIGRPFDLPNNDINLIVF